MMCMQILIINGYKLHQPMKDSIVYMLVNMLG